MNNLNDSTSPIKRARALTTVRQPLPNFFNPLFRNQGGVNRALIEAIQDIIENQSQLDQRSTVLERKLKEQTRFNEEQTKINKQRLVEFQELQEFSKSCISTLRGSVDELKHSREALIASVSALRISLEEESAKRSASLNRIGKHMGEMRSRLEKEVADLSKTLPSMDAKITKLETTKKKIAESLRSLEAAQSDSNDRRNDIETAVNTLVEKTQAQEKSLKEFGKEVIAWQSKSEIKSVENTERFTELIDRVKKSLFEQNEKLKQTITEVEKSLSDDWSRANQSVAQLEQEFSVGNERLERLIEQTRSSNAFVRRPSENLKSPTMESTISPDEFDNFYKQFEDQFRGNRESVFEKQSRHLDVVKEAVNQLKNRPKLDVLDLGCGRGEWLELVGTAHLKNKGVDQNATFIQQCIDRELNVVDSDVIEFLKELDDNSCGAVTAFHLIEHLSFAELWLLYKEVIRVLVSGGVGIFETPNPNNLRVASHFFLTDITHVRPVPPSLAAFLATYHGATKTEVQQYHPFPEADKHSDLPLEINDAIYGPQDYSVIFYK